MPVHFARLWLRFLLLGGLIAASASAAWTQNSVHCYRYDLSTRIGDDVYSGPIADCSAATGGYVKVERDALGRVVGTSSMLNGKVVTSAKYHFTGAIRFADSGEFWQDGEITGTAKYTNDASGLLLRAEFYTPQGVLSGYIAYTDLHDNRTEVYSYTPDGQRKSHLVRTYSPQGICIRTVAYKPKDDAGYVDKQWDPQTGLATSGKQYSDGKLLYSDKYTYDADGDLTRMDAYHDDGTWFGGDEYQNGLKIKRLYKFSDGTTKEVDYSYDSRRRLTQSQVLFNGKLVCNLSYDRDADGTVRRTMAVGPDGALWAEYPAPSVADIERDGHPINRADGTVHHPGNWW